MGVCSIAGRLQSLILPRNLKKQVEPSPSVLNSSNNKIARKKKYGSLNRTELVARNSL